MENVRLFDEIQERSRQLQVASEHKSQFVAQENLGTLTVDPMRLGQILLNLLGNT
jgi:signal transduction histidine kinase